MDKKKDKCLDGQIQVNIKLIPGCVKIMIRWPSADPRRIAGKVPLSEYRLGHLHMCRDALEEGFSCSPNHWPCLENLMTVSFKLDDNKGRPAKKHFSISDEIPEDLIEKRRSTRKMLTGVQPSLANSADSSQEVISSFRPNRQASLSPSACFEPVRLIIIR